MVLAFVSVFSDPKKIEDPFQWKPETHLDAIPDDMIGRLSLKIEEKSLEEEMECEIIILHLALAYEHFLEENVEKSQEILRNMLDETTQLQKSDGNSSYKFFAVEHLLCAATTHILIYLKNVEDAQKEFEKITCIPSMDGKTKAALWGFRATFYAEFGIYGSKAGVEFAIKAIEMDPNESLWYFVKGKLLGRTRRVEKPFDIPSSEELEALETAIDKESNAAYAIFTAQVYRETANRAFRKHKNEGRLYPNLKEIIDKMNAKSSELYKKSLALKPHCSHVNFRCAKGFLSLPPPFKDPDLAKKCTRDGLKMAPTSAYGNHVMAMYYERYAKDIRSAVSHLKLCLPLRVFGAYIDLLRIEYKYDGLNKSEILQRLQKLYDDFPESPRRCQTLSYFISYYLFIEFDLEKAINYLIDVFRLNLSCDDVRNHRSFFLDLRWPISLLDVVVDETKIQLNDPNCSAQTRAVCNKFLLDLADLNIAYSRSRPHYLRKNLLKQSESFGGGGPRNGSRSSRGSRRSFPRNPRPPPSGATTMTYLQRRHQFVVADETLKKIDDFTNSWKTELPSSRVETLPCSRIRSSDSEARDRDSASDDENPLTDDHVQRLAKIRYEHGRPSSTRGDRPQQQQQQWPRRTSASHRFDDDDKPQLESLVADMRIAPSDDCDSDFEKTVLAYRRAKQGVGTAASDRRQSLSQNEVQPQSSTRSESGPSNRSAPTSSSTSSYHSPKKTRHPPRKPKNGDTFADYVARSTAQLKETFEPGEIQF